MTGNPDRPVSGMGLYGSREIVENFGGTYLYTTTFEEENPVFIYIIPKDPINRPQIPVEVLGTQFVDGNLTVPY